MGFATKPTNPIFEDYGIDYELGITGEFKINTKDCFMQFLGSEIRIDEMQIQILKVVRMNDKIFYPHKDSDKPEGVPYEWLNILFLNLETNKVCSTMIKTYSHTEWRRFEDQIAAVTAAVNGKVKPTDAKYKEFDFTDFVTTISVQKSKKNPERFVLCFSIAKDADGDNMFSVVKDNGKYDSAAKIQYMPAEQMAKSAKFFADFGNKLFSKRLLNELVNRNYKAGLEKVVKKDPAAKMPFVLFAGYRNGFFTKEVVQELISQASSIEMPDDLLQIAG